MVSIQLNTLEVFPLICVTKHVRFSLNNSTKLFKTGVFPIFPLGTLMTTTIQLIFGISKAIYTAHNTQLHAQHKCISGYLPIST